MTPLTNLWTTVVDFWAANSEAIILGTGATLTLLVSFLLWRFIRTSDKSKIVSTIAAVVVMAWTSEGLLAVAVRKFDLPVGFAAMTFFVFEAMMLAAALKAEEHRRRKGAPGAAGGYVFVIAAASGIVSAFGAHNVGEVVLRIILPPLSVGLWWIFLIAERPDDKPEWIAARKNPDDEDSSWTITPRTVLVWIGLMKPGKSTMTEAQRERRVARMTTLAYAVYSWPSWSPPNWWASWRLGRLGRHVDDAMVDEASERALRAATIVDLVVPVRHQDVVEDMDADADADTAADMTAGAEPVMETDTRPDIATDMSVDTAPDMVAVMTADADTDTQRPNGRTYERTPPRTDIRTSARTSKGSDTATKADRLLARFPDMDAATLAKRLSVSDRQARRYIAARQSATPADDDQERHPEPLNGSDQHPDPTLLIGAPS